MFDEMMNYTFNYMVEQGIATVDELHLACALCGSSLDTLNSVLYIRTGYRSVVQLEEELDS